MQNDNDSKVLSPEEVDNQAVELGKKLGEILNRVTLEANQLSLPFGIQVEFVINLTDVNQKETK